MTPNLWVGLRWSTEFFLGCSSAHKDSPSGSVEKVSGGGVLLSGGAGGWGRNKRDLLLAVGGWGAMGEGECWCLSGMTL
jgi:hypothetical protein